MQISWSEAVMELMERGVTQAEIAKAAKCSQGRISQIRKESPVHITHNVGEGIKALCQVKGVSLIYRKQ